MSGFIDTIKNNIYESFDYSKLNLIDTEKKFISDIKQYLKEYYD